MRSLRPCSDSSATPSFPSQPEGKIGKAEVDVYLELSCFFDDPADIGNLISGSSAFSKSSLNIWMFMVRVLLKPCSEDFDMLLACEMSAIVQ